MKKAHAKTPFAMRIIEHLYPILLACYAHTIDSLKCAEVIKQLRRQHYEATGIMAHEPDSDDSTHTTIKAFWNKLNKMLIQNSTSTRPLIWRPVR